MMNIILMSFTYMELNTENRMLFPIKWCKFNSSRLPKYLFYTKKDNLISKITFYALKLINLAK